ncbi:MAG: aminoacyl-tRNA hydrolase [Syntrophomonadaceae bacterium]|jgi:PTH1 family peptidyl-tRNA hydrolase|nr:aminoacyl-tRNA hydrolase [Syntrophomonadaceae bacterium]
MKMVVGLGNPGSRYETSKHNVGFMALDLLADRLSIPVSRTKHGALIGEGRLEGIRVVLCKPQTFMNLSGTAVAPLLRWYGVEPGSLIVVSDDLDLEPGRLRIRPKGGAGGHRGIASIIEHLGAGNFIRLKLGIGRPPAKWAVADYVLADFSQEEWGIMRQVLPVAVDALNELLQKDVDEVMNKYNPWRPDQQGK